MLNPNAPKITLTFLEHTLILYGDKPALECHDLCGNLPILSDVPVRHAVSIEEFERDMRGFPSR